MSIPYRQQPRMYYARFALRQWSRPNEKCLKCRPLQQRISTCSGIVSMLPYPDAIP